MKKQKTREEWLMQLTRAMRPMFKKNGFPIPDTVKVSCSFPGGGRPNKRIGEAWPASASKGKTIEIFISPVLADSMRVADVLCHELIHAAVGNEHGHRGPFPRLAKALGLGGKMTATVATEDFTAWAKPLVERIGEYPHTELKMMGGSQKKQGTRLVKVECLNTGYIARTTNKWLEEYGAPICPCCNDVMTVA